MLSRQRTIRQATLLLLGLVLAGGCRTTDPSIQLLESELRYLEDKVYSLQDVVSQKEAQIASVRRENESLRERLGLPDGQAAAETIPSPLKSVQTPAPQNQSPTKFTDAMNPVIELGEASDLPDLKAVAPNEVALESPVLDQFTAESKPEPVTDRVVTQIFLNPKLTGGYNSDGRPGDEGLMVVLEPRNAAGQYVDAVGPVSVVLLDPTYSGQEGFVARWDYDTADAAKYLQKTLIGKGLHLKMPWTGGKPEHENLILHVRYTTSEGEVLQEKKEIKVDLRDAQSARWTPATVPLPIPRTAARNSAEASSDEAGKGLLKRSLWWPFR